jgi:hypothetical protein
VESIKGPLFKAAGDGVTDDYNAMVAGAKWLTRNAGATLVYPPGDYKITRIASWDHTADADCTTLPPGQPCYGTGIEYVGISHVRIQGCPGTRIVLQGVDMIADYNGGSDQEPLWVSTLSTVDPFIIKRGSAFVLDGFEIDGQAEASTRPPEIVESGGVGVSTWGCSSYTLSNLNIHHMTLDGILIGGGLRDDPLPGEGTGVPGEKILRLDADVTLENIQSEHNARQGLTVDAVRRGVFRNITTGNSGNVESLDATGSSRFYGFAPKSGVDVEPDFAPGYTVEANLYVPQKTGDLTFDNLHSHDNLGASFGAGFGALIEYVTVENSLLVSKLKAWPVMQVQFGVKGGVIQDSIIDVKDGEIFAFTSTAGPSDLQILRTIVYTSGQGIAADLDAQVFVGDSHFIVSQPRAYEWYFPDFENNANVTVWNSSFHYPWVWDHASTGAPMGYFVVNSSGNNAFTTDYPNPGVTCLQYQVASPGGGDAFSSPNLQPCP